MSTSTEPSARFGSRQCSLPSFRFNPSAPGRTPFENFWKLPPEKVPVQSLPKFLGRIQACVGLGFVLGPMTMTILHRLFKVSTADTFYAAAVFPLVGLFYALFRLEETKSGETGVSQLWRRSSRGEPAVAAAAAAIASEAERRAREGRDRALASRRRRSRRREEGGDEGGGGYGGYAPGADDEDAPEDAAAYGEFQEDGDVDGGAYGAAAAVDEPGSGVGAGYGPAAGAAVPRAREGVEVDGARRDVIPRAVMLLVGNGFLLMYAFSIETIYAMFLKVRLALSCEL